LKRNELHSGLSHLKLVAKHFGDMQSN